MTVSIWHVGDFGAVLSHCGESLTNEFHIDILAKFGAKTPFGLSFSLPLGGRVWDW